jgi:hypothetical protein
MTRRSAHVHVHVQRRSPPGHTYRTIGSRLARNPLRRNGSQELGFYAHSCIPGPAYLCLWQVLWPALTPTGPHAQALTRTGPHAHRPSRPQALTRTGPHAHRPSRAQALTRTGPHAHRPSRAQALTPTGPHAHRPSRPQALTPTGPHAHRPSRAQACCLRHCCPRHPPPTANPLPRNGSQRWRAPLMGPHYREGQQIGKGGSKAGSKGQVRAFICTTTTKIIIIIFFFFFFFF